MMRQSFTFCVPCLFGLEGLAADELRRLDLAEVRAEDGRVFFTGSPGDCAKANLNLRCGERVLLEIGSFPARSFDALFEGVRALPWEDWLPRDAAFPVTGYSLDSALFSVPDCQRIIKKAVVDSPRPGRNTRSAFRSGRTRPRSVWTLRASRCTSAGTGRPTPRRPCGRPSPRPW